ncbi:MAG: MXAN_6521/LA_1396 family lipoprotein [Myxococcaceae bacterium]|nr:MXAN_6521/LA_1396 family lipoprotein [Myxococcaceae bacterium]
MTNRLVLALGLAALTGCSAVKAHLTRPDYEQVDQQRVKRLVVVTQPLPDGKQALGELWSLFTRQYVNQNRDFLVKENLARPEPADSASIKALCTEGIEGVLWLEPQASSTRYGAAVATRARLLRCVDGEEVWSAEAAGDWHGHDPKFLQRKMQFVEQFGREVDLYVVPSLKLLQATLSTLPNPRLNDQDIEEKIELGE